MMAAKPKQRKARGKGLGEMPVSEFARLGGYARADAMTPEQRRASARKAGLARQAARRKEAS